MRLNRITFDPDVNAQDEYSEKIAEIVRDTMLFGFVTGLVAGLVVGVLI